MPSSAGPLRLNPGQSLRHRVSAVIAAANQQTFIIPFDPPSQREIRNCAAPGSYWQAPCHPCNRLLQLSLRPARPSAAARRKIPGIVPGLVPAAQNLKISLSIIAAVSGAVARIALFIPSRVVKRAAPWCHLLRALRIHEHNRSFWRFSALFHPGGFSCPSNGRKTPENREFLRLPILQLSSVTHPGAEGRASRRKHPSTVDSRPPRKALL